jgi:hypothetical protein
MTPASHTGLRVFQGGGMSNPVTTNLLLGTIAAALVSIAVRPYVAPNTVHAQANQRDFYIEPGVQMLRMPDGRGQVFGKVIVDLRNGKIWGFPTYSQDVYPTNIKNGKLPVSQPFALGQFALDETSKLP